MDSKEGKSSVLSSRTVKKKLTSNNEGDIQAIVRMCMDQANAKAIKMVKFELEKISLELSKKKFISQKSSKEQEQKISSLNKKTSQYNNDKNDDLNKIKHIDKAENLDSKLFIISSADKGTKETNNITDKNKNIHMPISNSELSIPSEGLTSTNKKSRIASIRTIKITEDDEEENSSLTARNNKK